MLVGNILSFFRSLAYLKVCNNPLQCRPHRSWNQRCIVDFYVLMNVNNDYLIWLIIDAYFFFLSFKKYTKITVFVLFVNKTLACNSCLPYDQYTGRKFVNRIYKFYLYGILNRNVWATSF